MEARMYGDGRGDYERRQGQDERFGCIGSVGFCTPGRFEIFYKPNCEGAHEAREPKLYAYPRHQSIQIFFLTGNVSFCTSDGRRAAHWDSTQ